MSPAFGKRRALGQHFLRDRAVAQLIAETATAEARKHGCHALLEIGPGKGAITDLLLEEVARLDGQIKQVILAERDRELAARWRDRADLARETAGAPVDVAEGDFLELPEERWLGTQPLAVASNLPYSAGTAILVRLAAQPRAIPCMVLMFQAEVAHRLRAQPSTKDWGSLSVWVQNQWDVRKLCAVPPGAFAPPPDVNSEVVVLNRLASPRVPGTNDDAQARARWDRLLRACFAHRRKMLRSGLGAGTAARKALDLSGLDGTKRAEALNWEEWQRLFQALREQR